MSEAIGRPMVRLDGHLKVTGTANYAADWPMEHLAHAVIFGSTIPSGKIRSFDFREAKAVPGVIEILTYENAPKLKKPGPQPGGGTGEDFLPLQDNLVRYNGQHLGAVIAETLEAATQAARLISIQYSPTKSDLDIDRLERGAYVIEEMKGMGKINMRSGNFKKAYQKADVKLNQSYTTPIENHNPMEPSATFASYADGEYKIYDSTQGVYASANLLSQALELPIEKVHVITKFVGGGFGCKGTLWPHQFIAAMCAQKVKRPVKLVLNRQQMFTGVGHRARTQQQVSLAASKDGVLQAISHTVFNNTSPSKDFSERSGTPTTMLYKCENIEVIHHLKKLNYQVPTFMRAPGESTGSFALECALDELAHQLAIDPVALRLRNHADEDQKEKKPFSSKSLRQCYDRAAVAFGWSARKPSPKANLEGSEYIGYGMATATYPAKAFPASAQIELLADGTARVTSATQDIGTGSYTAFTQISADSLGLDVSRVTFDLGDSRYSKSSGSGGSTTLSSVGTAIKLAADNIKAQLAKLATGDSQSPLYQASTADIGFSNGRLHLVRDPKKGESFSDLMRRTKNGILTAKGEAENANSKDYSGHSFGAQFAKVRVNRWTGEVRIEKMTSAFACGKIVNPMMAKNQFMGGLIFGIGMALMEHSVADQKSGRFMIKDLADYHVPVQADVPELDIIMVDEKDSHINAIGTKGIGEIGIVGAAAAIANAVFNATGVRVRDLPLTPEKIALELARS